MDAARAGHSTATPADQRVRVLILGTTVPAQRGDGTPSFVLDLAAELATEAEVTVLAPRVAGSKPNTVVDGAVVRRFPYFPRPWEGLADDAIMPTLRAEPRRWIEVPFLMLSMMWHTWRLVRRDAPSVINAHWIVPAGAVAWVLRRLTGVPYVVTAHGADAYTLNGGLMRIVKRAVLTSAFAVLPVSRDIGRTLQRIESDRARITEPVPMGVAPVAAEPADRSNGAYLFVGRLAEKKGVATLLDALAQVPTASLTVIGDGPDTSRLMERTNGLGLDDRVRFAGRQPRAAVLEEMAACRAVVIPSVVASDGDREGTPVVLAEAMALGAPVIASRLAGLGEYVHDGETGVLVEPGSVSELRDALVRGESDPAWLIELGRAAAADFEDGDLNLEHTARRYRHVFDEAVTP